ncbi:MAG: hypothetical protein Q9180_005260, partial [Flavoplaca navasiana]
MACTRIRGGTPTEYEPTQPTHHVTDPRLLALLEKVNRMSHDNTEKRIKQSIDQARSEYRYRPPPNMCEPDPDDLEHCLPSPASSPPRAYEQHPLTVPQDHAPVFTPTSHHSLHSPSTGDAIEHEQRPNAIPQGHSPLLKTESH